MRSVQKNFKTGRVEKAVGMICEHRDCIEEATVCLVGEAGEVWLCYIHADANEQDENAEDWEDWGYQ